MSLRVAALLALALALAFSPAFAGDCSQCNPQGDCEDAGQGYSGNCYCIVRNFQFAGINFKFCTPKGVCDPSDPNTCGEGQVEPPPLNVERSMQLAPGVINHLGELDWQAAFAVQVTTDVTWTDDQRVEHTYLVAGEYAGATLLNRADGSRYEISAAAVRVDASAAVVTATVTTYGTRDVRRLEIRLWDSGRIGELVDDDGTVVPWELER